MASNALSVVGLPRSIGSTAKSWATGKTGGGSGPEKGADEDGWDERGNQMSKGGEVDQFHE
jgi:hypothetical protein